MIEDYEVFEAIRRGYNDLHGSSDTEIISYFQSIDQDSFSGHASHIKGILFEQEYIDSLESKHVYAEIFDATNHPVTDVKIFQDGEVINEIQLKATDSLDYVKSSILDNPDVTFATTTEVANRIDSSVLIDSGIENSALEQAINDSIVNDFANPLSPLSVVSWLFGLPFL